MKTGLFFLILCFGFTLNAQTIDTDTLKNITVQKDPRIDILVKRNKDINEEVYLKTIRNMQGYRMQVINTNDRNKALTLNEIIERVPGEKHTSYTILLISKFRLAIS